MTNQAFLSVHLRRLSHKTDGRGGSSLATLPAPPSCRRGWPWTAGPDLAAGAELPRISIVTPSFQQAPYLEKAIRSVLMQGYPNLEYIIIDGGSTDGSVEIIRKYEPWLSAWVSEPDAGQASAIARGFAGCTGSLLAWLNADDRYEPGSIRLAAEAHVEQPDALVAGSVLHIDERSATLREVRQYGLSLRKVARYWEGNSCFQQPGLFFPRALYESSGRGDVSLDLAFDLDLLCRFLAASPPVVYVERSLAAFRRHARSKSVVKRLEHVLEVAEVSRRYAPGTRDADERAHRRFVQRALLGVAREEMSRHYLGRCARASLEALRLGPASAVATIAKGLVRRGRRGAPGQLEADE